MWLSCLLVGALLISASKYSGISKHVEIKLSIMLYLDIAAMLISHFYCLMLGRGNVQLTDLGRLLRRHQTPTHLDVLRGDLDRVGMMPIWPPDD